GRQSDHQIHNQDLLGRHPVEPTASRQGGFRCSVSNSGARFSDAVGRRTCHVSDHWEKTTFRVIPSAYQSRFMPPTSRTLQLSKMRECLSVAGNHLACASVYV